ncbi:MAG: Bug family tripartite tricarboxylate transporter substrate binding protein [Burkholderiales bacterium]
MAPRGLLSGIAAAMIVASPGAIAQYPSKPIRLVVPNPPGGAVDTLARLLSPALSKRLGQPLVVENRVGSNGNIAIELVARASADGYTLIIGADAQIVINPHLYPAFPVDTLRDLAPIASIATTFMMLTVNPALPARTIQEFIEHARRANPPLAYASIGNGSQHHLTMELFKQRAGIDMLHIPYKGGGPATVAILAGDVAVMFGGNSTAAHIKSGKLRGLAVASTRRSRAHPDLPALSELYPGVEATTWIALFAPAGTAEPLITRLRDEIAVVLNETETRERFANAGGMEPFATTPAELSALIKTDYAKYGAIVKAVGVKVD